MTHYSVGIISFFYQIGRWGNNSHPYKMFEKKGGKQKHFLLRHIKSFAVCKIILDVKVAPRENLDSELPWSLEYRYRLCSFSYNSGFKSWLIFSINCQFFPQMSHEGDLHFEGLKNLTVSITGGDVDHDTAHTMVSKCIEVGTYYSIFVWLIISNYWWKW